MNPYSIPVLISSLLAIFFGIFVMIKKPHSMLSFSFFTLCLSCFVWLFFCSLMLNTSNKQQEELFSRILYCGVAFLAATGVFYTSLFSGTFKKLNFFSLSFSLISCYLIFNSPFIINGVKEYFWGSYPLVGTFHPIFLVFFIFFTLIPIFIIWRVTLLDKNVTKKNQAKYLFLAFLIFNFASIDYVPNYKIAIYPFGYIPAVLFLWIIFVAILKHRLMDINIVIRRGVVYSTLIAIFTIVYLCIVIFIERLFQGIIGYQSVFVSLLSASFIAIFFIPLRNGIQRFLDRRFFQGTLETLANEQERLKQRLFQTEKLAYVGKMASSVVHEIKSPLTAIKTYVEYLPKKFDDPSFKEKFQNLIPHEIERIDKIVHQLLDLAKPRNPDLDTVDVHTIIDTTLSLLENNFQNKSISVRKNYAAQSSQIQADHEQLQQVFLNLFLNSIDAMSAQGILSIETKSLVSNKIAVIIADNGAGISKENLTKLFTPFFTTKREGIGLGLVICKEIIEAHTGTMKVESEAGKGTRFILEFPSGRL